MSIPKPLPRPYTPPRKFHIPNLPIMSLWQLAALNRDLKAKKFRLFLKSFTALYANLFKNRMFLDQRPEGILYTKQPRITTS